MADAIDEPSWSFLWQNLTHRHDSQLLQLGRDWLDGREDKPEWNYVWQRLIELGFEPDSLLPMGRDWLGRHKGRPEYPFVYHTIYKVWPKP